MSQQLAATAGYPYTPQGGGYMLVVSAAEDYDMRPRYFPSDLLYSFTLKMAARGFCVSASMMLGARDYALEQLSLAHTLNDEELRELAVRMFAYFDEAPIRAAAQLN